MLRHRSPACSPPEQGRCARPGQRSRQPGPGLAGTNGRSSLCTDASCSRTAQGQRKLRWRRSPRIQLPAGKNKLLAKAFLEGQNSNLLRTFYRD